MSRELKAIAEQRWFRPALGAALTILCGVALWSIPLGERWVNASYDYLFLFGHRTVTNKPVLILMDDAACLALNQPRNRPWDRKWHTQLLQKLADDKSGLVVFDVFFREEGRADTDAAFAEAIRRQGRVVLMADVTEPKHPDTDIAQVISPLKMFRDAAAGCGLGKAANAPLGGTARQHWSPGPEAAQFQGLPLVAASLAGAQVSESAEKRWLRYYGVKEGWEARSYQWALTNVAGYFKGKTVFIGHQPENSDPGITERDKFRTPYTRWNKKAVGGVEIMATIFLNLVNGDWLRRPAWWLEALVLVISGILLGALHRARPLTACGLTAAAALGVMLVAVSLSYFTNYWFPWLVIVGGQVPCALAWAVLAPGARSVLEPATKTEVISALPTQVPETGTPAMASLQLPDAPDYELFDPPFAEGAYGKVWLARNAIGQWQALKAVYQAKFGEHTPPYEREFSGIKRYKPVSEKFPGLLRVDFVSAKKPGGYFYYVMELGDSLEPGWQENPALYTPRDLAKVRALAPGRRLPARECVRIGLALAEALGFLHRQGVTHRDIKPQNVIFVNGHPKLADVGLVAEILPPDQHSTYVGTPGYMPPPPEPPGTPRADIYGLGILLYVIHTGQNPAFFPEVSTTLVEQSTPIDFIPLNDVILKACQPDLSQRYASAAELRAALLEVQKGLERNRRAERT